MALNGRAGFFPSAPLCFSEATEWAIGPDSDRNSLCPPEFPKGLLGLHLALPRGHRWLFRWSGNAPGDVFPRQVSLGPEHVLRDTSCGSRPPQAAAGQVLSQGACVRRGCLP